MSDKQISVTFNKLNINDNIFETPQYNNDDYILYVLVNDDLNMNMNKIIHFCCRAVYKVIWLNENCDSCYDTFCYENYIKWIESGEKFSILSAKEIDLLYCVDKYSLLDEDIWCTNIIDIGRTDISVFSLVCVAFTPISIRDVPDFINKMDIIK